MKNTYLYLVFKKNKFLFFSLLIFIILTIFTTVTEFQITPIMRWDVYSTPYKESEEYTFHSIEYNDHQRFNYPQPWNHHKTMMVYYTLNWYERIVNNGFRDPHIGIGKHFLSKINLASNQMLDNLYASPEQIKNYPTWLKAYLCNNLNIKIDSVSVYQLQGQFNKDGEVIIKSKNLVFKI